MDAELVELAGTAGTAIVTLLATDVWERTKTAVGGLWRKVHPDRADTVAAELAEARAELLAARAAGDTQTEHDLVGEWQARLRRLLAADPAVADPLRHLLDELRPYLPGGAQVWTGDVRMTAKASGNAQINQLGQGVQHITGR
ncbi:MAG TPA: hypothetical protein VIS06_18660 [Mycobacteriales bacterium]